MKGKKNAQLSRNAFSSKEFLIGIKVNYQSLMALSFIYVTYLANNNDYQIIYNNKMVFWIFSCQSLSYEHVVGKKSL